MPESLDLPLTGARLRRTQGCQGTPPNASISASEDSMDDRQFDSLTKSLAVGRTRRQALKGLIGLGGAVVVGSITLGRHTEAARRSLLTPTPQTCPGSQVWNGSACVCLSGTLCGPACCTAGANCCDGACCAGICYLEEFCCPNGNRLCADGACLPPGSCCGDSECPPVGCHEVACNDGTCEQFEFDCRLGTNCCPTGNVCLSETGRCCVPNNAELCKDHCGPTQNNCGQTIACSGGCLT